jgi:branched-chain amino acid transport system permease protein
LLLVILFRPAGLISLILSERERVGNFGRPPKKGSHGPA